MWARWKTALCAVFQGVHTLFARASFVRGRTDLAERRMSTPLVIEHFDYILLYRGDREALSGSLDRIQRAASVILKAVSDCG